MRCFSGCVLGVIYLVCASAIAKGDIVVGNDGQFIDGKIVSATDKEIIVQPDGPATTQPTHIDKAAALRIVYTDEHGAMIAAPGAATQPQPNWNVPPEPAAPAVEAAISPSYYVIPLHGEVGTTVLASALEKSFADALLRKPTVVILDIDSPGGSVAEAEKIMQLIHHYNRALRIVALTNQDLSAAAIFTLSVKTIYVKPTSTIGAATSYVPGHPDLSAKVEEKMQSAWRAVARNSAEEGGHNPLLADAMIDNTSSLHLETVNGKPVVKSGDGDNMIVAKGKILTLTSHEAIDCGLAVDDAEDFAAVGVALGFANWTECTGLGTVLADYLPKNNEAFEAEVKKIAAELTLNFQAAAQADPTQENTYVVTQNGPMRRQFNPRQPVGPGNMPPGMPPNAFGPPQPGPQQRVVRTSQDIRHWKQRSLACVVAIQKAEQNFRDIIAACQAFGHAGEIESVKDALTKISAVRAKIYDDRNKYGDGITPPPNVRQPPVIAGNPRGQTALSEPSRENAAAQLKKIDAGWQTTTEKSVEILPVMQSAQGVKFDDGSILLSAIQSVISTEKYQAPVTFRMIVLTSGGDLRIAFPGTQIIFNWELKPDQLRVDGGPANGKHKDGVGKLPIGEWVGIELVVNADEMIIYIDGQEKYRQKADFSTVNKTFAIIAHGGMTKVKSVSVIKGK